MTVRKFCKNWILTKNKFLAEEEKEEKMNFTVDVERSDRCGAGDFCFIYCDLIRSKIRQRNRIQAVRDMSSHIDVMREKEVSYTGKKRLIPFDEFDLIMSEMKNIFTNLLKKISNSPSLRHIAKHAIHLYQNSLLISELPEHLQVEVCDICQDTIIEEKLVLKFINNELEHLNQLYNRAFSSKLKSCVLL